MSEEKKNDLDNLRWVRVFSPLHIPRNLIEQVRDRDFSVEDFYKYHECVCLRDTDEGPTLNPFSHLYVLADKENIIRGVLWFVIDALTKDIVIQTYSIEKNYWEPGKAILKLIDHIKEIKNKAKLHKVYWITNYPRHSKKYGFKESKSVLMEYSDEPEEKQVQMVS